MVHGILQFTPSIAFRYVLHRCESRDIRCRESFCVFTTKSQRPRGTRTADGVATGDVLLSIQIPWRDSRRGFVRFAPRGEGRGTMGGDAASPHPLFFDNTFAGRSAGQASTMILPQVHLRKPCYDFSFL